MADFRKKLNNSMRITVIGRSEVLYDTVQLLLSKGHEIPLIITAKEAPEYTRSVEDFENLAQRIGAAFILAGSFNSREMINVIKQHRGTDVGVSFNYSSVISQQVIDLFSCGILNAHGGDLPRYRGNACQAWAIINGETRIGLCIHKMVGQEIDSGDIICRDYMAIDLNTRVTQCWNWMKGRVPELFLEAVTQLSQQPDYVLEPLSTNPADALRCYPRMPGDGRIDWQQSNETILRLINASNKPYAGAFGYFDNQKIIIWDAELFDDGERYLACPGQVAQVNEDGSIIIISGNGKLKINLVEYQGQCLKPRNIIKSIRKRLQ